jgi:hypothetical protein
MHTEPFAFSATRDLLHVRNSLSHAAFTHLKSNYIINNTLKLFILIWSLVSDRKRLISGMSIAIK